MKLGLKEGLFRINSKKIAALLFILGFLIGIIIANCFKSSYKEQMKILENDTFAVITTGELSYQKLFFYSFGLRVKEFFIFWLLCITILGIPYLMYKIVHTGYIVGFFLSVLCIQYGIKGLVLSVAYIFPQFLIYLPITLVCLKRGYLLAMEMKRGNSSDLRNKAKLLYSQLLPIFIMLVLIGIGCVLETYVGAAILKKAIGFVLKF